MDEDVDNNVGPEFQDQDQELLDQPVDIELDSESLKEKEFNLEAPKEEDDDIAIEDQSENSKPQEEEFVNHSELPLADSNPPKDEDFAEIIPDDSQPNDSTDILSVPQIIETKLEDDRETASSDNIKGEDSEVTHETDQTPASAYINTSAISSANASSQPSSINNHRDSASSILSLKSEISESQVNKSVVPDVEEDDEDDEEEEEEEEEFQTLDEMWANNAQQRKEEFESQRNQVMSMSTTIMDLRLKWHKLREDFILERAFIDDTDSILIESRISEIKSMCRFIIRPKNVLLAYTPETQVLIMKYAEMDQEQFTEQRRKHWKSLDLFNYVFRMVRLMCGTFLYRRKYKYINEKISDAQLITNRPRNLQNLMPLYKCSVGQNLRRYLTNNPKFRSEKQLKLINHFLQQNEAFTSLFPAEMEMDCAMAVSYEQYDDGRLVALQDKAPERFYYILEGKLNIVRHFKLTLGEVNRSIGVYSRGMTTDPTEMTNQTVRNYMLIAKGLVEVLVLHKSDYFKLIKYGAGPPTDFLGKIDSFREFPMGKFLENEDAINVVYYGRNKVIFSDSAYTPWIYLVKSGTVKVVRKQTVYKTKNELSRTKHIDKLEGKPNTGHATAMLGLTVKQREFKKKNSVSYELPPIDSRKRISMVSKNTSPHNTFKAPWRNKNLLSDMLKPLPKEDPVIAEEGLPIIIETVESITEESEESNQNDVEDVEEADIENIDQINADAEIMRDFISDINENIDAVFEQNVIDVQSVSVNTSQEMIPEKNVEEIKKPLMTRLRSPVIRIPHRRTSGVPWAAYISTGQRSQRTSVPCIGLFGDFHSTKNSERPAIVQVDTLHPGDAFGFYRIASWGQDIRPKSASRTGISLVSEGAEVIRVSKRFFVKTAKNNTMLLVDLLNKQYLSQYETKEVLQDRSTWNEYKSELMKRMVQIHSH